MSADRVLVLGGTGFIGRAVVAGYVNQGAPTRVLARVVPAAGIIGDLDGAEVRQGDAGDPAAVGEALEGIDHVVYAVGQLLPQESTVDLVGDVMRSLPPIITVLEALRARPGVSLTFLSSGGTVYGSPKALPVRESAPCEPITGYGITKLASEKYIGMYRQLYGVRSRILRVANVYGPGQPSGRSQGVIAALLAAARSEERAVLFGDSVRDYVYIDDVVRAIVELHRGGDTQAIVNVGSGIGHSLGDVVEAVESAVGTQLLLDRHDARSFDIREIVLDVSALASMMDWKPRSLDAGVEATWRHLMSNDTREAR
jgi:UDP-glucose 4-epimerase